MLLRYRKYTLTAVDKAQNWQCNSGGKIHLAIKLPLAIAYSSTRRQWNFRVENSTFTLRWHIHIHSHLISLFEGLSDLLLLLLLLLPTRMECWMLNGTWPADKFNAKWIEYYKKREDTIFKRFANDIRSIREPCKRNHEDCDCCDCQSRVLFAVFFRNIFYSICLFFHTIRLGRKCPSQVLHIRMSFGPTIQTRLKAYIERKHSSDFGKNSIQIYFKQKPKLID